jgi:uncharacterized protein YbaP (TraB family)
MRARLVVAVGLLLLTGADTLLVAQAGAAQRGRGGVATRSAPSAGRSFIWSITGKGQTGWLVGSLHLLPPDAYPLPAAMDAAFQSAEVLIEEADTDELLQPGATEALVKRMFLPPGQTLEGNLSPATFQMLSERAAKVGLPVQALQMMRPWAVAIALSGVEMKKSGFDPALGLDAHFRERARAASKPVRPVESFAEQIGFFENLDAALQEKLVLEMLRGASSEVSQVQQLYAAWKAGDLVRMERMLVDDLKSSPEIHKLLLVDRNHRWIPKIEDCLSGARCMIVVGAGHLLGNEGLIALLRGRGYAVEQK